MKIGSEEGKEDNLRIVGVKEDRFQIGQKDTQEKTGRSVQCSLWHHGFHLCGNHGSCQMGRVQGLFDHWELLADCLWRDGLWPFFTAIHLIP